MKKTIQVIKKIKKGHLNTILWILVAAFLIWLFSFAIKKMDGGGKNNPEKTDKPQN